MEKICKSLAEVELFAKEVLDFVIKHKKGDQAFILRLVGDLGAGKTTFVKIFSRLLGVEDSVLSPTFVLQKFYYTKHSILKRLIHIDAYRIEESEEARILSLDELAKDPEAIICIEWPEKIKVHIPESGTVLTFTHIDPTTRKITLDLYV